MKVLYDHQIFESQKFGGVSKYFGELIFNSGSMDEVNNDISILHSDNGYLKSLETNNFLPLPQRPLSYNDNSDNSYSIVKRFFDRFFYLKKLAKCYKENKEESIQKIITQNFDVFHPTYYDDYFLKHIKNKPFVLTVHDLTHQIFPEYFSPKWIDKSKEMLENARRIIVVSENTKKDLMDFYDIKDNKIDVVYLASSILEGAVMNLSVNMPPNMEKYLLYIGSRASYKNFYFFVQAIVPLFREDKGLYLLCTGDKFSEEELFFFAKLGIAANIKHIYATEDELPYIYQNAVAFVYPSLYEGFGMPILEAFACGCPVICSQASSFPEIAGPAAIYFEPKNKQSIYKAVYSMLNDNVLRTAMIVKGFLQLEKFSWLNTAAQTREVYSKAIAE
ncbi:glycosyltransferase family 4 protein [Haliscomenobacter hydrossis]|uniref:Glycosyl transferase group 1 n=1 Tax=Haliscomenobacter hydrossis (strain ATCC 27775 / DSM 1100 / LMG 10767 / O) TaxID=760192 RepID=F4KR28_HALH1|nr:glycosyltransferase family 1 protein [Haliscomenobacter hydrossis]AEE53266.1 glycosyl transferase group 1 [Haliscomenobacter hydrossis DSM 1100]